MKEVFDCISLKIKLINHLANYYISGLFKLYLMKSNICFKELILIFISTDVFR